MYYYNTQSKLVENGLNTLESVVINGITWVTRNMDTRGTFAAAPEEAGKYYQWNKKLALTAPYAYEERKFPRGAESTEWQKENDPCPQGWRVPTKEEFESLCDTSKVDNKVIVHYSVNGRLFTDKSTKSSIFFPIVGYLHSSGGWLIDEGVWSGYWSSSHKSEPSYDYDSPFPDENYSYILWNTDDNVGVLIEEHNQGLSIRCVKE